MRNDPLGDIPGTQPWEKLPKRIAIVGAGLAGAALAVELSRRDFFDITVFDQRDHVAGNAHTERDPETGVMVHKYGPHIFHTDSEEVWNFIRAFGEFVPYVQRTKAIANGQVYSFPINLHTINQVFGTTMRPPRAAAFIRERADSVLGPAENFEEHALRSLGRELYDLFIKGYTEKQWGMDPKLLPASILKRLPLRFDFNDNAYAHKFQGIPRYGYTAVVANMLETAGVSLRLNTKFTSRDSLLFDHTFYSGPIDEWFGYKLGRLPYRTLDFEVLRVPGDFQGCSVINYCDPNVRWTRSTEHKHFTPWEQHDKTIVYAERSRDAHEGDIPYYPIRFAKDKEQLSAYQALAAKEDHVTFIGRLGTYRYIDMDVTVAESIQIASEFHETQRRQRELQP